MAKKYILIDYENVKAVDLEPIFDKPYHLMVFVGASQSKISTDFAMQATASAHRRVRPHLRQRAQRTGLPHRLHDRQTR